MLTQAVDIAKEMEAVSLGSHQLHGKASNGQTSQLSTATKKGNEQEKPCFRCGK